MSVRRIAALGVLVVLVSTAVAVPVVSSATPARVRVVWDLLDRVYVAWSASDGARVGARAVDRSAGASASDTLVATSVMDDITEFEGAAFGSNYPVGSMALSGSWLELISSAPKSPTGTLTVPISALPATLDPAHVTSLAEKQVGTQLFEGLFRADRNLVAVPGEVDSTAQNGNTYTFRLRAGARFSDGSPVGARDVIASLARALSPSTRAPRVEELLDAIVGARAFHDGTATDIAGLRAPDSMHVEIDATHPGSRLFNALATPAAWIIPAAAGGKPGFAFEPVGSGPFRYAGADSAGLLLVAAPGSGAGVDTLRFRLTHGPEDAALQFELGRIDLVAPLEEDAARLLAGTTSRGAPGPPRAALSVQEIATYYVGMNTRAPWLADRTHRRAIAGAIDRGLAVRVLLGNRGVLAHGLLPSGLGVSDLADGAWQATPAEAAALPRLAPPTGGLSFWVPEGSASGVRVAEFVQAALGRHGVSVHIVTRRWAEFERGVSDGKADLFYWSWFADGLDPVAFVSTMIGSQNRGPGGNRTFYANAAVDSLLGVARAAGEPGREAALLRAETIALADAPLVPLFHSLNVTLVRPWVKGLVLDPLGCPRYDTVEVTRGR